MNGPSHKEYAVPNQYRIVDAPEAPSPAPHKAAGNGVRPLLWLVLVVSVAANAVLSTAEINTSLAAGFGTVALGCAVALVVQHYRHRR